MSPDSIVYLVRSRQLPNKEVCLIRQLTRYNEISRDTMESGDMPRHAQDTLSLFGSAHSGVRRSPGAA
eukprot:4148179-Prymnesium_polylepis.1